MYLPKADCRYGRTKGRADIGKELKWMDLVVKAFLFEIHLTRGSPGICA
jgi:hypothetical protein